MQPIARLENKLYVLALFIAPLLLAISTFLWQGEGIGYAGGIIQVYSYLFWIPAMLGLLSLLRAALPTFAVWGTLLVCWVCLAGNNFGMEGIYLSSFAQAGADVSQLAAVDAAMTVAGIFVLYMPGLLFPLTLALIAFLLWRKQAVPPLYALLLVVGALAFPLSRVPRIVLIAHVADLLLLVALWGIGWLMLQGETKTQSLPSVVGVGDD